MYGLLIASGIVFSILYSEKLSKRLGLDNELFWQAIFWAILSGIIGARLYHVLDFWEIYSQNFLMILQVWHGGLGIFGAIIFGTAALVIFLRKNGQNVWKWLDIFALPIPLAQAVGRWGNYLNQELMPYALYEAAANILLFLILIFVNKKMKSEGTTFFTYLAGYSTIRLLLEPTRELPWTIGQINVAQAVSLALIISCAIIVIWKKRSKL